MDDYVRSCIDILNDKTCELENLNKLGIYLSKQVDINALKTLKLIILASEVGKLERPFYINCKNMCVDIISREETDKKESIFGNLAMNPNNFALDLFEYLVKNYPVDWGFECYGIYSILEVWVRSFGLMRNYEMDLFYGRYDMLDKKMDILEFAIRNGCLNYEQRNELIDSYMNMIKNDVNLTDLQKEKMKNLNMQLEQRYEFYRHISANNGLSEKELEREYAFVDKVMGISESLDEELLYRDSKKNALSELKKYRMQNDQCIYILNEIPKLIKHKII